MKWFFSFKAALFLSHCFPAFLTNFIHSVWIYVYNWPKLTLEVCRKSYIVMHNMDFHHIMHDSLIIVKLLYPFVKRRFLYIVCYFCILLIQFHLQTSNHADHRRNKTFPVISNAFKKFYLRSINFVTLFFSVRNTDGFNIFQLIKLQMFAFY